MDKHMKVYLATFLIVVPAIFAYHGVISQGTAVLIMVAFLFNAVHQGMKLENDSE